MEFFCFTPTTTTKVIFKKEANINKQTNNNKKIPRKQPKHQTSLTKQEVNLSSSHAWRLAGIASESHLETCALTSAGHTEHLILFFSKDLQYLFCNSRSSFLQIREAHSQAVRPGMVRSRLAFCCWRAWLCQDGAFSGTGDFRTPLGSEHRGEDAVPGELCLCSDLGAPLPVAPRRRGAAQRWLHLQGANWNKKQTNKQKNRKKKTQNCE